MAYQQPKAELSCVETCKTVGLGLFYFETFLHCSPGCYGAYGSSPSGNTDMGHLSCTGCSLSWGHWMAIVPPFLNQKPWLGSFSELPVAAGTQKCWG